MRTVYLSTATITKEYIDSIHTKYQNDISTVSFMNNSYVQASSFMDRNNIADVRRFDQVKNIDEYAFKGTSISAINCINVSFINNNSFQACTNLKSVTYSNNSIIGDNAFDGCTSLLNLNRIDQAAKIGKYAFKNCCNIVTNNIKYPKCELIDVNAFEGTPLWNKSPQELRLSAGMQKIIVAGTEENPIEIKYYNPETYVDPDSIVDFSSLQANTLELKDVNDKMVSHPLLSAEEFPRKGSCRVVIGGSITKIAPNAFNGCAGIYNVTAVNVEEIGKDAFKGCTSLSSIDLGANVVELKPSAFKGCDALKEVKNLDRALSVDDSAFEGCISLEEANLSGATYVGVNAFKGCISLSSIDVSNATKVCDGAFSSGATEFTIHATI